MPVPGQAGRRKFRKEGKFQGELIGTPPGCLVGTAVDSIISWNSLSLTFLALLIRFALVNFEFRQLRQIGHRIISESVTQTLAGFAVSVFGAGGYAMTECHGLDWLALR